MKKTVTVPVTYYSDQYDARAEVEILKDQFIVAKNKHGDDVSMEYLQQSFMVITAIDA